MKVSIKESLGLVAMLSLMQASIYPAELEKAVVSGDTQGIKAYIDSGLKAGVGKRDILGEVYRRILEAQVIRPSLVEYFLSLKPDLNKPFISSSQLGYLPVTIQHYYFVSHPSTGPWYDKDNAQQVLEVIDLLLQQPGVRVDATIKEMIEHPFA